MEKLAPLVGSELDSAELDRALRSLADRHEARPSILLEVTCSDGPDPERLPLAGGGAPFRITNPGARYEQGAVTLAEQGLAMPLAADTSRLLIIRILGHVSVRQGDSGTIFESGQRCAALAALFAGNQLPFADELAASFRSFGLDRLALLAPLSTDETVRSDRRWLYAAALAARLEARRAALDLLDCVPRVPTLYAVAFGVTLSRRSGESELLGGLYTVDRRAAETVCRYVGLGDDPSAYRLAEANGRLFLEDDETRVARPAAAHGEHARRLLLGMSWPDLAEDERLRQYIDLLEPDEASASLFTCAKLKVVLRLLARSAPIQTAMLLYAEGLVEERHAPVLCDTVISADRARQARAIIECAEERLDELDQERVGTLTRSLLTSRA